MAERINGEEENSLCLWLVGLKKQKMPEGKKKEKENKKEEKRWGYTNYLLPFPVFSNSSKEDNNRSIAASASVESF